MGSKTLVILLHLTVLFIAPPFFAGVINRVKSIFSGRKGPPILQLYFDIFKLLRKGAVYSRSTSFFFTLAPVIVLSSVICAGLFLPMLGSSPVKFAGDAVLFVYLFALVRFAMIAAAMDVGSSFEGMGASREATFGAFAELTVFMVIATLSIVTGSLSLDQMFVWDAHRIASSPAMLLLFASFFFILLAENSRMPVDDPNTHLELTMVHEVMILDHSGPDLGLMLYGASMKLFIFMAFAAMLVSPNPEVGVWMQAGLILLKVACAAVIIGIVESVAARIRLIRIPQMLIAAFVLSVFALLVTVYMNGML